MKKINELKQLSGATKFASVLGKSTIDPNREEYVMIEKCTEILLKHGYGIIHGGYAGGAMQATSNATNRYIQKHGLPKELNIGVPQRQHDGLWDRVESASFTTVANDIYERLQIVTSGDIAVVCPLGGDGTELEETIVFHENVVKMGMNKYGGTSEKMTPLIFLQTKDGTDWKTLIQTKLTLLDTSVKDIKEYDWLYFINSIEEFEEVLESIK
jgi:predicted Rossmann-fold nucleotide-binding protein